MSLYKARKVLSGLHWSNWFDLERIARGAESAEVREACERLQSFISIGR